MNAVKGTDIIKRWPEEAREPAQLVNHKYGEPAEATESVPYLARRRPL